MKKHFETAMLVVAILIGALFFASPILSLYNFTHIEQEEAEEDTLQVRKIIDAETQQLYATAGDYAGWDDAYAFMRDGNPKFISSSLGEAFYSKLRLNLFCMVANDGTIRFCRAHDYHKNIQVAAPSSLLHHLNPEDLLLKHASLESGVSGFISLPEGLLMIVSRPILTTEYKGPPRGTLIIGRFLDQGEELRISKLLNYKIGLLNSVSNDKNPVYQEQLSRFAGRDDVLIRVTPDEHIAGYVQLTDIYGKVAGLVRLEKTRTIYHQAQQTTWRIILLYGSMCLILFIIYMLLRNKLIIVHRNEQQIRDQLQAFIELAVDGIFSISSFGTILKVNSRVCEMTGYSRSELLAMRFSQLFETGIAGELPVEELCKKEGNETIGNTIVRMDGRHVAVEITSKEMPDGTFQCFMRDVSQRKKLEKRLHAKQALLNGVINGTTDIVYAIDLDGCYTLINRAGELFAGATQNQIIGSNRLDIFYDAAASKPETDDIVFSKQQVTSFEESLVDAAGKEHVFQTTKGPLFDETGVLCGLFAIMHDVSVYKAMESELVEYHNRVNSMAIEVSIAEERERNRIAGELHDQVGPNLLLGKLKIDQLQARLPDAEYEDEFEAVKEFISRSIQDIRSLTFQLRPPILANAGLEAALRWLAQDFEQHHGIQVNVLHDEIPILLEYGVRVTLFQAVRELLLNVAKHAAAHHVVITLNKDPGTIVLIVEDDGAGFSLPRDYAMHSNSFGLFNTQQRIKYHGGQMHIDSSQDRGTRIFITMPLEPAETP